MEFASWHVVFSLLWLVVVIWAAMDAFTHTDMGCMWLCLFIFVPPLAIPIYVFMRLYTSRSVSRQVLMQRELEREQGAVSRFPTEIEKARYIAAAEQKHGTMYNPQSAVATAPDGFRHFADNRADSLLDQRRYEEAAEYLLDMYAVAAGDHDARGQDTYRHYLGRIPGGRELLHEWEVEHGTRRPGDRSTPRRDDEMPF